MQDSIQNLIIISQEDQKYRVNQKKLKAFPAKKKKIKSALNRIKTQIKETNAKIEDFDSKIKERERLITIEKEKSEKANQRMSAVTNQKEFAATQKEIDGSNKIIKRVEDQILEYEEKKEGIKAQLEQLQADYDAEYKNIENELQDLLDQEKQILNCLEESQSLKKKLLPTIGEEALKEYNKLFERNVIPSVVEITTDSCMGCAMGIPLQLFHEAVRNKYTKCPHCSRILVYKAPEPTEEKSAKKKKTADKA